MGQLRSPSGGIVTIPDDQIEHAIAGGYSPVSVTEAGQTTGAVTQEDTGALGAVGAGLTSVASGATLGLSDLAFKGLLNRGHFEDVAAQREQHPIVSGLGQVAGSILPSIVAPGSTLARAPAGYLSRAAAGAIEDFGGGLAAKALVGAGEGAIYNAGAYLSDTALGDRELTAEGLSGALGSGFAFGAAGAVGMHGIETGTIAARRMFARVAEGGDRAALDAASAWDRASQSTLDANDAAATAARAKLVESRAAREQAGLARDQASVAIADAKAAGPEVDAQLAQARTLDSNIAKVEAAEVPPAAGGLDETPQIVGNYDDLARLVAEHDDARAELERALASLEAPDVGMPGGRIEKLPGKFGEPELADGTPVTPENRALMDQLDARARQTEGTVVGKRPAPAGEPSLEDLLTGATTEPAAAAADPAWHKYLSDNIGKAWKSEGSYAAGFAKLEKDFAGKAAPSAGSDLESLLAGTKAKLDTGGDLNAIGAPARAEYAAAKDAKTSAAAEHFRAKANAKNYGGSEMAAEEQAAQGTTPAAVPEHDAIRAHEDKFDAELEQTLPASAIAERGYYEPPGGHADAVRNANAKKAIAEGQQEAIKLNVTPSGKITVTNGRHRLQAAIEADAPIKVRWSTGFEPAESDVLRGGAKAAEVPVFGDISRDKTSHFDIAQSDIRFDPKSKSYLDKEGARNPMGYRQPATTARDPALEEAMRAADEAHPLAAKQLEQRLDAAHELAASTADAATKQAAIAEAAAIEKQLTAVGARPGAVEDVALMAKVVTRYEKAAAAMTEALGEAAPPAARESAAAFRAAEDAADKKTMARTARAVDDAAEPPVRVGKDRRPSAIRSSGERIAAARTDKLGADAALARARVAETEARIGARARDVGTVIETAHDLGVPGIPKPSDIPVIGPLLGMYLKYRALKATAGRFVGRVPATAEARAAALAARTKDKIATAVDQSLGLVERAAKSSAARTGAVAGATKIGDTLRRRAFDDGEPDAPKDATPQQLAAVRIREVANAATRPELIIARVRQEMRGVSDPDLLDAAEKHQVALYQWLNGKAPKAPPPNPFSTRPWEPSPALTAQFARRLEVAHDPTAALEALRNQSLTPEAAETFQQGYPKLFAMAQARLVERAADVEHPIPYQQKLRNGLLFSVPLDPSMEPATLSLLQTAHASSSPGPAASPAGPPPAAPAPSVAAPTNLTALYQTASDRRATR